jgi:hypothetical protein
VAEALQKRVEEMEQELLGPQPSALERTVVERIVVCWLQVQFAETACVEHFEDSKSGPWQRRLDQAQRRHLAAVKTLATIRALLPAEVKGRKKAKAK